MSDGSDDGPALVASRRASSCWTLHAPWWWWVCRALLAEAKGWAGGRDGPPEPRARSERGRLIRSACADCPTVMTNRSARARVGALLSVQQDDGQVPLRSRLSPRRYFQGCGIDPPLSDAAKATASAERGACGRARAERARLVAVIEVHKLEEEGCAGAT